MNNWTTGTNRKAINFAVLTFLLFAMVLLGIAAVGMSGVKLAEGAMETCLMQGLLCALAVPPLAARLRFALPVAGAAVVGMLLLPNVTLGFAWPDPALSAAQVAELSKPPWERGYAAPEAYPEAPAMQRWVVARQERLRTWLEVNSEVLTNLRSQGDPARDMSDGDLRELLVSESVKPSHRRRHGVNRTLETLAAAGFQDDTAPPSAPDQMDIKRAAEAWVAAHPPQAREMMEEEHIERQIRANRTFSYTQIGVWIGILALGGARGGRVYLDTPFNLLRLPGQVLAGLRKLLAPDPWAPLRILIGVGLMLLLGGIAFIAIGSGLRDRTVIRLIAAGILLGGMVVLSGLSFQLPDEEQP